MPNKKTKQINATAKVDEEQALRSAAEKARQAMNKKPCKQTVDNFTATNQALEHYLAKQAEASAERTFKTRLEIVKYLQGQGFKIQKTKVYDDVKKGRLPAGNDGRFTLSAVEQYAKDRLERIGEKDSSIDNTAVRKQEAEADKLEAQAAHWRLKSDIQQGKYILREQVEADLAARAAYLKTDFENFFRTYAGEIVNLVGGDPAKTPDLLAFGLDEVANWLNRYAKKGEFTI